MSVLIIDPVFFTERRVAQHRRELDRIKFDRTHALEQFKAALFGLVFTIFTLFLLVGDR